MSEFREIAAEAFDASPFRRIGKDWMLIAAERGGKVNAMTASWGGMGVMWNKNVAFIVIRPQRYTKEFVDGSGMFSLNFLDGSRRADLNYFGSTSGRDEDKIAKTGLTVERADGASYFGEADTVFLCRKLYAQPYREECFLDQAIVGEMYPKKDFHTLYVGEVIRILVKD